MSFSDDDKEALGEDLDELKQGIKSINEITFGIHKDLRTLVTMAWISLIVGIVGPVIFAGLLLSA
jgi:hypothetical protein